MLPRAEWAPWLRRIHEERLSARALYGLVGAEARRNEDPYLQREAGGVLIFRGFRFDPATASTEEAWRAITQYDAGVDRIRGWLRRARAHGAK